VYPHAPLNTSVVIGIASRCFSVVWFGISGGDHPVDFLVDISVDYFSVGNSVDCFPVGNLLHCFLVGNSVDILVNFSLLP